MQYAVTNALSSNATSKDNLRANKCAILQETLFPSRLSILFAADERNGVNEFSVQKVTVAPCKCETKVTK
jgi:hypothetical protein